MVSCRCRSIDGKSGRMGNNAVIAASKARTWDPTSPRCAPGRDRSRGAATRRHRAARRSHGRRYGPTPRRRTSPGNRPCWPAGGRTTEDVVHSDASSKPGSGPGSVQDQWGSPPATSVARRDDPTFAFHCHQVAHDLGGHPFPVGDRVCPSAGAGRGGPSRQRLILPVPGCHGGRRGMDARPGRAPPDGSRRRRSGCRASPRWSPAASPTGPGRSPAPLLKTRSASLNDILGLFGRLQPRTVDFLGMFDDAA